MAHVTLTPARAMEGTLTELTVPSTNVPGPVAITYYLPKNYDAKRAEPYPLLIQLHGGGSSNKDMGSLPPCGSGCPGGNGGPRASDDDKRFVTPALSAIPPPAPP